MEFEADICIVGAGIVGLGHALEARRRGLRVIVLDRSERAVGASVRNFGHAFVTAMADGEPFDVARRSRELWLELAEPAGIHVLRAGSVIVARHADELAVLAAVAADPERGARMLTPAEAAAIAPIAADGVLGALHCPLDLRVNPREAVAGLAALLARDDAVELHWGACVDAIEPGLVRAGALTVRAPLIAVCPGPDYAALPASVRPHRQGLTLCKLQMLRVAAPDSWRCEPAVLTGLSLLRYPAFSERPEAAAVRARLERERPELVERGIHLIVTQLPDGDLILGDTHWYGDTPDPFRDERLDGLVLAEAAALLGNGTLDVRERWIGIYPTAPGDPFMIECPLPGVAVAEVVAGVGMTTGLGLAAKTLDLLGAPTPGSRPAGPHPLAATRAGCEG
jgi:FAD dependent oxidoreductase TIGR03364